MNSGDTKKEFNKALAELVEFATVSGNHITKEVVHDYFHELITDEKMYDYVYKYLADAKITVEGYDASPISIKEAKDSNEALAFYEMYLDEMNALTEISKTNIPNLLKSLVEGDTTIAGKLSEAYLPLVIEISEDFKSHGHPHSELVAEGNLALFEAILAYPQIHGTTINQNTFEAHLRTQITEALKSAINQEIGSSRISKHLADQVNALNDISTELAKELGREATLEELCEKLSLDEDEVKELMKISINALTVVDVGEDGLNHE